MQFRYKLKKEFFGGIIYDSKCKKNISIDSELFALLESLLLNKESNLIMTGDEIIESIKQLLLLGVLSTNIIDAGWEIIHLW